MLTPAKTKYRKQQKGRIKFLATKGNELEFGDFGLISLEPGKITNKQIEAARVAISRYAKRGGKLWVRIFPDKPLTKKPLETRMGKGKGAPEEWVAVVSTGTMMYEVSGISRDMALEALRLASHKLPVKTKIITRED